MLDQTLRQLKEQVLQPIAERLPVHPLALTAAGLGAGLLAGAAAYAESYPLALGLWIANRVLDGLDGTVARIRGRQSDLGAYLDILADFTIYATLPALMVAGRGSGAAALVFLLVTFYLNAGSWMYLSALLEKRRQGAESRGEMTGATMPTGVIEGTETALFYGAFLLFPAAIEILFVLMGALVLVTIAQRVIWAVLHLKN